MIKSKKNKLWILFCTFCYCANILAQSPTSFLGNYLQNTKFKGELIWLKPEERLIDFNQDLTCYTAKHNYLWYKNKLTIQLDGSGRLYHFANNDSITRIDKTCYEGYNFDAYNFVFNDTLFNLGGYGFWQFNSHLRYYDENTAEWSARPTNKNIPIRVSLFSQVYLDKENHKLYVTYVDPEESLANSESKKTNNLYVQCLDLYTRKWWDHEKIFQDNALIFRKIIGSRGIPIKQGLMFIFQKESYVFDYKENKAYKLNRETQEKIISLIGTLTPWLIIPDSSGITFFDKNNLKLHNIKISNTNLIQIPDKIYTNKFDKESIIQYSSSYNYIFISFFSIFIILLFVYIKSLKNRIKNITANQNNNLDGDNTIIEKNLIPKEYFRETLTEIEITLLDLLISNSINNQNTSVSQINHAMGLSKKATTIQNNIRAGTILIINKKFRSYSGIKDDLIQKERTDFDKRFFEYFINKKLLTKVK
jgi:hypothetical protein